MKANELRVGNLVYYNGKNKEIGTITGLQSAVSKQCYIYLNNRINNTLDLDMIKPIPLTEELYRKIEKQLIKKGFSYGFEKGKLTLYLSDEWEFESEHVHQLQNLYFALTNEELTIKL